MGQISASLHKERTLFAVAILEKMSFNLSCNFYVLKNKEKIIGKFCGKMRRKHEELVTFLICDYIFLT